MSDFAYSQDRRVRKRTVIMTLVFFLWFFGLTLRLVELQVIEHGKLRQAVVKQNQAKQDILPERGEILDRRGKVLARSLPFPSVILLLGDEESSADAYGKVLRLSKILDLSGRELQRIKTQIDHHDGFIYVKRKIAPAAAEQISGLRLEGIGLQEENKRCYPLGTLAAHALGGVGMDNEGLSGLELQYESRLAGRKGQSLMLRDAKKRAYHWEVLKEPVPGQDQRPFV